MPGGKACWKSVPASGLIQTALQGNSLRTFVLFSKGFSLGNEISCDERIWQREYGAMTLNVVDMKYLPRLLRMELPGFRARLNQALTFKLAHCLQPRALPLSPGTEQPPGVEQVRVSATFSLWRKAQLQTFI